MRAAATVPRGVTAGPLEAGALVQRKCACGGRPGPAGECEECRKRRLELRRKPAAGGAAPEPAPPAIGRMVRTAGRPLEPAVRRRMEDQLGHDFGAVRIHTGSRAAESARSVHAEAFTIGSHVAFGAGAYEPSTPRGRGLLAHELTHVLQQRGSGHAAAAGSRIEVGPADDRHEREARRVERSVASGRGADPAPAAAPPSVQRGLLELIDDLFGGTEFSDRELQEYLDVLETGRTAGGLAGDNKARVLVNRWRVGGSAFVLTAQIKALLIEELLAGGTYDDDEQAILELLERSYNFELSHIFGAGGITVDRLDSALDGVQQTRLDDFFNRRFAGGKEGMEERIEPIGYPVRLGESIDRRLLPHESELEGADLRWNVPCVLGILCSMDEAVVRRLPDIEVKRIDRIEVDHWTFDGTAWSSEPVYPTGLVEHGEGTIGLVSRRRCPGAASTLFHEVRHVDQDDDLTLFQMEIDAYTFTERWAIDRGLPPGRPRLRTHDEEVDTEAIDRFVRGRYGGPDASDAGGSQIVGHTDDGQTILRAPDGTRTTRPSVEGDNHLSEPPRLEGVTEIDASQWSCP